jgi:monoterpene epsilon-lactone hydrolase
VVGFALDPPRPSAILSGILLRELEPDIYSGYRLAPEHLFQAATEDVLACYQGLAERGVRSIALTGDSAAGNLGLALASRVTNEAVSTDATLVAVGLLSPVADLAVSGTTYETRADANPPFMRPQVAELVHSYLAGADAEQPLASPLYSRLTGMAPVRIPVGDDDVLLDSSLRFVACAAAAGVDARLDASMGMPHGHAASIGRLKAAKALDALRAFVVERLPAHAAP